MESGYGSSGFHRRGNIMLKDQLRSAREIILGTAYIPLCLGLKIAADLGRLFGRAEAAG
jgi:hypothetical protein